MLGRATLVMVRSRMSISPVRASRSSVRCLDGWAAPVGAGAAGGAGRGSVSCRIGGPSSQGGRPSELHSMCSSVQGAVMLDSVEEPRNARSRRTRAALLDATRALLEEHGTEWLTMAAVAERAGVSRRAVYLHFASRAELLTELFGHVSEREGLAASLQPVWDAQDAAAAFDLLEKLLVDRGWSGTRFRTHLAALLRATFLCDPGRAQAAPTDQR